MNKEVSVSTAQHLGYRKLPRQPRAATVFKDGMPENALVPIAAIMEWRLEQAGRWKWCETCMVCIPPARLKEHRKIHRKVWNGVAHGA